MMHNSLFLNRLIIYTQSNSIAYDESFHKGVNIIRGDNSSGKSTITHFIFYVLGGAFNDWVKEAKFCSKVIAEIEVNGATLVLKRELNFNEQGKANPLEPMYINWGGLVSISEDNWKKFNFQSTPNIISFSNVLFNALEIPIVKGESNITMHQILRLLYIDQESPTSSLFLYEQFDTTLTRETVADLLIGVYNQDLYDRKQRKIAIDKELDEIKAEIKAIKRFSPNIYNLVPSHIETQIAEKKKIISEIDTELFTLRNTTQEAKFNKKTKLEFQSLNEDIINQRNLVNNLEQAVRDYINEIDDSKDFILELENKIKAIQNSIKTRDFLGEFSLEYCPNCLSKLPENKDSSLCCLCKQQSDNSQGITQARKIEQELRFQLKESTNLLILKERKLLEFKSKYEVENLKLYELQTRVNQSINDVKSVTSERIDQLLIDKGYHEGEIMQFLTMLENAEIYQGLNRKKRELEEEQSNLNHVIDHYVREQFNKKKRINSIIEQKALFLLKNDLERQAEFSNAQEFHIDYRNNIAFITDKSEKYSASSNFYLKTAARFAIFLASLEISQMRFPRFIFCDNMEDKGIEYERAQNFQKILINTVKKRDNALYQLIYTTSYIPQELDIPKYTVGEYYTKDNKSLKNVD